MLFGAGEQSLLYADAYLQVYLFGTLFSMLSTGMSGFINAQGFPKIGMTATVVGAVINIALDPLLYSRSIWVCEVPPWQRWSVKQSQWHWSWDF